MEFTFKGKRSYQTSIGAFVSLLIKLTLIAFIMYEFYLIFSRKHPAVSVKYVLNDLANDPKSVELFKDGFDIALGFSTRN